MKLEVPHIHQERGSSCWHACARMLYAFRNPASIHPLPAKFDENKGIAAATFIELAKSVGLKTLPRVYQTYDWTYLEGALGSYGPLWAAGQWNGYNHIIVVTGVDGGGKVYVNDPAFPAPVERNIAWFNDKIDKNVDVPLMYLPA